MNIAFVKVEPHIVSYNGVRLQALMWKEGLEDAGHSVTLVNMWESIDWTSFDVIHIFQYGGFLRSFVEMVYKVNNNIVLSPIIDADCTPYTFKIAARFLGSARLKLHSNFHDLYSVRNKIKLYNVRSEFEKTFLLTGLNIEECRTSITPLSYRIDPPNHSIEKENFCLHVSRLYEKGKNVAKLIEAAKKYKFNLLLGGKLQNEHELRWLNNLIDGYDNIQYIGYLSENELVSFYSRAKVFALPSLREGVGMVAIEAAIYGCDIVITNIGGPKEYFDNLAYIVNPHDIDQIGKSIQRCLEGQTYQPSLKRYIIDNYNLKKCIVKLADDYRYVTEAK